MSEVQDNPYSTILNTFRHDTASRAVAAWTTGVIKSLEPLAVDISGRTVTNGLSINALLLGRVGTAAFSGFTGSIQAAPEGLTVTGGALNGGIALGSALAPGDRVVLLQSGNGQEYIILCKVV